MATPHASFLAPALTAALAVSSFAPAQTSDGPRIGQPGSLLVFPVFDTRPSVHTKLALTNVNRNFRTCTAGRRMGDVELHFVFVDATTCHLFDRTEFLAPGDTFAVDVAVFQPNFDHGWLWVYAQDPETNRAIDFDYVIGAAFLSNTSLDYEWEYAPYSFRSLRSEGLAPYGTDACGNAFVDAATSRTADFDGAEYDFFPQHLLAPHFVGEGHPPGFGYYGNKLFLCGPPAPTTLTFLEFDDDTHVRSAMAPLECWRESSLVAINASFRWDVLDDQFDASELGGLPYGWIDVTAPGGVLGCLLQLRSSGRSLPLNAQATGATLQFVGTRSGVQFPRP
jgi:hypothetical protein